MASGPFVLKSPPLTTYNQQLWLIAKVDILNKDGGTFILSISIKVYQAKEIVIKIIFIFLDDSFEKTFSISMDLYGISSGSVVKIYNTLNKQSRHLKCHGDCEPFTVLHLGFIDFAKYFIVVRFSDLKGVHERYHIKDVHFYVSRTSKEQISK